MKCLTFAATLASLCAALGAARADVNVLDNNKTIEVDCAKSKPPASQAARAARANDASRQVLPTWNGSTMPRAPRAPRISPSTLRSTTPATIRSPQ